MPNFVENRTPLRRPGEPDDYADVDRLLVMWAEDFRAGTVLKAHRHRRAQLVYAAAGVMTVTTPAGTWVVPPLRAVWVPAGTDHAIRMSGPVAMRTLYVRADAARRLPGACCVLGVTPLLRELILRAIDMPILYDVRGREGRLTRLLLDELRLLPVLPLNLPMPEDRRLDRVCRAIIRDPGASLGLEEWAERAGASGRTLARLFQRQTNMSFGAWRQQARLLEAISRIAAGASITTVAFDLGYESSSAFTYMFRRALGVPPSRYFAHISDETRRAASARSGGPARSTRRSAAARA
jgi:AraC-like DNA-binding protein